MYYLASCAVSVIGLLTILYVHLVNKQPITFIFKLTIFVLLIPLLPLILLVFLAGKGLLDD